MRSAREVAHAHCAEESVAGDWCACSGKHLADRPHSFACDRLTRAIEARDRELVEALNETRAQLAAAEAREESFRQRAFAAESKAP